MKKEGNMATTRVLESELAELKVSVHNASVEFNKLMGAIGLSVNAVTGKEIESAWEQLRAGAKITDDSPEGKYRALERYGIDLLQIAIKISGGQELIAEILESNVHPDRLEMQLEDTMQKILDRNWMRQAEKLKVKINSGQCSDEEALLLAKEFSTLKQQRPKVSLQQPG